MEQESVPGTAPPRQWGVTHVGIPYLHCYKGEKQGMWCRELAGMWKWSSKWIAIQTSSINLFHIKRGYPYQAFICLYSNEFLTPKYELYTHRVQEVYDNLCRSQQTRDCRPETYLVSKILLKQSHSFLYCLWLFLSYSSRNLWLWQRPYGPRNQ